METLRLNTASNSDNINNTLSSVSDITIEEINSMFGIDQVSEGILDESDVENLEEVTQETTEENTESEEIEEEENEENEEEIGDEEELALKNLTPNSPSILLEESTSRFSSAEWFNEIQQQKVTLVGVGGINSYVAFLLGRMHINLLRMFDPDTVETVNMAGQLYSRNQIGVLKVNALAQTLRDFSDFYNISLIECLAGRSSDLGNIVICGLDNMRSRRDVFLNWKSHLNIQESKYKCLFIDGRLSAEEFQIFCMTGNDAHLMRIYENKWLFNDEEAEVTLCSYKQTSFCANMIASFMVNLFINFVTNLCNPLIPRDLPFMTRYDASTMMFKTKM